MSYDIDMRDLSRTETYHDDWDDTDETYHPLVTVARFQEGGTQPIGGTDEATLNVTYNYGRYFYRHLDSEKGIRWLYGKTGAETRDRLRSAITGLESEAALWSPQLIKLCLDDEWALNPERYWAPTPHNAIHPLRRLLAWAEQHPTAVFGGD